MKNGVRWLKDELCYLQSSVRAAEAKQEDELICLWINNVKDVADEAILILERFNFLKYYGISNILATAIVQRSKKALLRATSFENQVDVVGYEEDTEVLLAELVKDDESLGVISIHGMGGLGKTTLASK